MRAMAVVILAAIVLVCASATGRAWQSEDFNHPSSGREVTSAASEEVAMQKGEGREEKEGEPTTKQPGERCEVPVWKVGDYWRYRDDDKREWQNRVIGVEQFEDSQIYVVEVAKGFYKKGIEVKTLQSKVNISSYGQRIVPTADWDWHFDFPLYIGKKWEKKVSGLNSAGTKKNYLYRYRVLSFEDVAVLAGKFKAFKIERQQSTLSQKGGSVITYLWYSPEVKREVLFRHGSVSGNWQVTVRDYELISFTLAGTGPQTPESK